MSTPGNDSAPAPVATATQEEREPIPGKIYIGNLSFKTNTKALKEAFSSVGEVKKVNLVRRQGRRLGFGFLDFKSPEDVEKAIAQMNGKELDGRTIKVEASFTAGPKRKPRAPKGEKKEKKSENPKEVQTIQLDPVQPKETEETQEEKPVRRRRVRIPREERVESEDAVYVSGLTESASKESLEELFKEFNPSQISFRSSYRGRERPRQKFAIVTVTSQEDQEKALSLNETEVDGQQILVRKAYQPVSEKQIEEALQKIEEKIRAKKRKRNQRRRNKSKKQESNEENKEGEQLVADDNKETEGQS